MTDSVSHTSALSDLDVSMDDSTPPATNEELHPVITAASCALCDSAIKVGATPEGDSELIETSQPSLLFVDKDERPNWVSMSIYDFLQYGSYYMCLNKVVDLFLAQEARLGYPVKVSRSRLLRISPTNDFARKLLQSVRLALTCQNRPTEVAAFMKNARDFTCGDKVDVTRFSKAVIQWWLTIQPTTRKDWPPSYNPLPGDFSFDYFNRGGPNGVFLVILCLTWWANSLTPDTDHTSFGLVVHDVNWVLEQIATHA